MKTIIRTTCALALAASMSLGAQAFATSPPVYKSLSTTMHNAAGDATGSIRITEGLNGGLLIDIDMSGLEPGWRALHIHGTGDCSDHTDHFKKAGGHATTAEQEHGFMNVKGPHMGDLPNIWVAADGTVKAQFFTSQIKLADLQDADGASFMIHADADDYISTPAGNAGTRLACGVIGVVPAAK